MSATKPAAKSARKPAKELMAARKRMFFGASYINGVLGEVHRDFDKMVHHGVHLQLGTASELKKLKLETLRARLAEAILAKEDGATPFSIKLAA